MEIIIKIFAFFLLVACSARSNSEIDIIEKENFEYAKQEIVKEELFKEIDSCYTSKEIILPEGFVIQSIFSQADSKIKTKTGQMSRSKGFHDMISYIPINGSSKHGFLFVSHETTGANSILGDGGGGTIFEVKMINNKWEVISDYNHIDFSNVGNTDRNCGGVLAPNGMIYSCEESQPKSNSELYRYGGGHRDTSDINDLKYYQNIGYVVEIDPKQRKATKKMLQWGRFHHEDLEFLDDGKTVFLTDDYSPAVFFKFVANEKNDYSKGQLYAFSEGLDSKWLALPMDKASLIDIRNVAISLGATMFVRHEWCSRDGDNLYIAETGGNTMHWGAYIREGGVPANHLNLFKVTDSTFIDYFGRILKFNIKTNDINVYLEGGISEDKTKVLSNPDCIELANISDKKYLIIHEDIIGLSEGRVPKYAEEKGKYYNELFFLDLAIKKPKIEDAKRFIIASLGAEMTGGMFTPDGSTLFVNLQHPSSINTYPYNNSTTFAISGFVK